MFCRLSKTATTTLQGYNLPNSFIVCKTSWQDGNIYVEYSYCKTLACTKFSSMVTGGQTSCSAVHASCCKVVTNSSSSWSLQIYDLYPLDLSRQAELMILNDLTQKSRGLNSSIISRLPASAQPILRRQEAFHVLTQCSQGNRGWEEEEEEEERNPRVRWALQETQASRIISCVSIVGSCRKLESSSILDSS